MALIVNENSKSLYTVSLTKPIKLLDVSYINSFVHDKFISNYLEQFKADDKINTIYVLYKEDINFFDKKNEATIASIYSSLNPYKDYGNPTSLYDINLESGKGYEVTENLYGHMTGEILFSANGDVISSADSKADYNFNAMASYNDSCDSLFTYKYDNILTRYFNLYDNSFAKKNVRAYVSKELNTDVDWTLPRSDYAIFEPATYFIIVNSEKTVIDYSGSVVLEDRDSVPLELTMVVRNFLIPMERFDISKYIHVYKYPEWILNHREILQSVDRILVSNKEEYLEGARGKFKDNGKAYNSYHVYSGSDKFGYNPISYFSNSLFSQNLKYTSSQLEELEYHDNYFVENLALLNHTNKLNILQY